MNRRAASDRLRDLQSVTDAALAYLPLEELLNELLTRVVDILDADTAAILLLEDDDRTLVARAANGLEEEVERGVRIPVGKGFAGRVAATRKAVRIENVKEADIYNPILREKGLESLLGVPLLVEGDVIGSCTWARSRVGASPTTRSTCFRAPPTARRSRSRAEWPSGSAASPMRSRAA